MNVIHSITLSADDIAGMFAMTIFFQMLMVFAIYVLGKGIASHRCGRSANQHRNPKQANRVGRRRR